MKIRSFKAPKEVEMQACSEIPQWAKRLVLWLDAKEKSGFTTKMGMNDNTETTDSGFGPFDLRLFALEKLRDKVNGADFITYKDARRILGRQIHLQKGKARLLLLSMSKANLIRISKGKIFFIR